MEGSRRQDGRGERRRVAAGAGLSFRCRRACAPTAADIARAAARRAGNGDAGPAPFAGGASRGFVASPARLPRGASLRRRRPPAPHGHGSVDGGVGNGICHGASVGIGVRISLGIGIGTGVSSGGISIRATKELRFGVESYGELLVEGNGTSWYVVGPTVSLTSGRFWGAASYGIGVLGIRDAPRVTFGLAL